MSIPPLISKVRPAFKWVGGKSRLVPTLLAWTPPHHIAVEVFGGSLAFTFGKRPAPVEVINDINAGIVNFYEVVRSPDQFHRLQLMVQLTPYSRLVRDTAFVSWKDQTDPVERAYRWYIMNRMAWNGSISSKGWGYTIRATAQGMSKATLDYIQYLDRLPAIHERLRSVQIENDHFRKVIERFDTRDTFFYCDPPYVPGTWEGGSYDEEMTLEEHQELVDLLLNIKGMALLSGYANVTYQALERAGWEYQDVTYRCDLVGRTEDSDGMTESELDKAALRIERLWRSPNCRNTGQMSLWDQ